jgi:hypothetical protein
MILLLALVACSPSSSPPPPSSPVAAPSPANPVDESKPHRHDAPHGGIVQTLGDIHAEALFMPAGVMFYLEDGAQAPLAVDGYTGSAVVKGPSGIVTVDLMAMGDHLHAPATLVQGQPASAVLTLTHEGKAVSASFDSTAVGLASHDHVALHGGQVGMWGEYHLEYAPKDGEYRVWVTDEHRNPVAGTVTGSVKDGATVTPLGAGPDGALTGKGDGAGTRPVTVDVTVDGKAFSLGFNPAG